jgi:hypothetical protein
MPTAVYEVRNFKILSILQNTKPENYKLHIIKHIGKRKCI